MNWSDFQKKNINKSDLRFMDNVDGDPDFDLERHNALVEKTLKHNERVSREKKREYDRGIEERAFAAGKYIQQLKNGGESSVEKYFGKSYINYLRGQQILEKYKMAWTDEVKKRQAVAKMKQKHKDLA